MAVLRSIEQRIESLVEGVFGRAFRAHVQPVELARKLAKEMDDHRTVSVTRVYVPNEYTVYLSPDDRQQFEGYEDALLNELQEYLREHARRERYALLSEPLVRLATDDDLRTGVFGIGVRTIQPERKERASAQARPAPPVSTPPVPLLPPVTPPPPVPGPGPSGATVLYGPDESPEVGQEPAAPEPPALVAGDRRYPLDKPLLVIGRSSECDIQLADPNVSRRHAEIRQEGDSYLLLDLGSTNGSELNGQRVKRGHLEPGDRILIGQTELVFTQEQG
ncbi:MAG: FhaA domain-containing protein [Gaiellaceae bacterium]